MTWHSEIHFPFEPLCLIQQHHRLPTSLQSENTAEDEYLSSLLFHFHNSLGLLESLPEATMVQNIHNYILHMSHQMGIILLELSIYFDRNWKTYNERLCFLTSYKASGCQGYFFPPSVFQFDVEDNQIPRLHKPMCV